MKTELRRIYSRLRADFCGRSRALADTALTDRAVSLLGGYDSFFVYFSFGSEADTHRLIESLLSLGKRVFLPRTEGKNMVAVPYFGGELSKGAFGIPEPRGSAYSGDIDVTITPLLAVDGQGYRLGYGGGYYDRFFKDRATLRVGFGYDFQLCGDVQRDEWDKPLDMFISQSGVKYFN